jgi:GT2 family glycosyltransferase
LEKILAHITVGIVAFNTDLKILEKAVSSCKNSDTGDLQIVVFCNSLDEDYQKSVMDLCISYGVACLDHQLNHGFGAGHNTIVNLFPATWYVCCNPDIEVDKDTISKLIAFAEKTPNVAQITPRVVHPDGRIQPLARRHLTLATWFHRQLWRIFPNIFIPFEVEFDYNKTQKIEFVTGCFFLIRSELFKQAGCFDEKFFLYAEDADLSYRLSKLGNNYYCAEATVRHEWSTKWGKNYNAVWHEIRSLGRLFVKRIWSV